MKKNIYNCQKCGAKIQTGNRDQGVTPMMIGCRTDGCDGSAMSSMYMVDQDIEPELIFIKPKDEKEWNAIRDQGRQDIIKMFPNKKESKINKMLDRLMNAIREHVSKGGIVELPVEIVNKL